MSEIARTESVAGGAIVAATVRAVHGARVDVTGPRFGSVSARLAVPGYEPRAGDGVLVALAEDGCYVVGVRRALRDACPRVIEAPDGSRASLADEDGPVWRLHDPEGRLIFEHRAGRSVVHASEDLELRAARDLSLSAGGVVRIEGEEGAELRSRRAVSLGSEASELSMEGDRAELRAALLTAKTERSELHTKDAHLVAGTLRTVVHRLRERAEVVERTAERVVERAREVYREVEELSQTKAGRLRLVADTAMTLLGKSTLVKAREDVKVQGEKIYLG